ncbi:MAG: hypothetical protein LAO21_07885 [Acidobacteriia bacterium]|nr:hypothetical protein [Terriglobia bacterium]
MTHCLLCGTLNNEDFERCSLCKTEPERALHVVTESRRWVNVALVMLVFLALASSVALDLYLAQHVIFRSDSEAENGLTDSSRTAMPVDGKDTPAGRSASTSRASLIPGAQLTRLILDSLYIAIWLVLSVAFVGGTMYGAKRGTMCVCHEIMRRVLRAKVARNEYVFPGLETAHAARFERARPDVRGTL